MKHYIIADTHFRQDYVHPKVSLLDDAAHAFEFVLETAKKNKEKGMVLWHLGDVFDTNRPTPIVYRTAIKLFGKALEIFDKVIILLGNHDNNDSNVDALAPLEEAFSSEAKLLIVRDVCTISMNEDFICLPHLSRKVLGQTVLPSMSYNDAVFERIKLLPSVAKRQTKYCLVGHLLLEGAKYGAEDVLLRENAFHVGAELFGKASIGFLGHIHKPQKVGKIHYVGSPSIIDFSERNEDKRFIIYDGKEVESIKVPNPIWHQLDIDLSKSYNIKQEVFKGLKNKRVKIKVSTTEKTHYHVDMATIVSKVEEAGGFVLQKKIERLDKESKPKSSTQVGAETTDVFVNNITEMIQNFLKGCKESKEIVDEALRLCLKNIDVGKYNRVQKGRKVRLHAIVLKNFFSYHNETITFERGLTGVIGRNGVGKSSLIDGIIYALTGEERGERAGCSLMTGASEDDMMQVTLCLLIGSDKVRLTRGRKRRSPFAELTVNGKLDTSGESAVTKRMEELLGVDYNTLVSTSIFREEFQDEFMRANASSKEKFLCQYFGLDFIKDSYAKIRRIHTSCKDEFNDGQSQLKVYEEELKRYDVDDLKVEVSNWTKDLEKIDDELSEKNKLYQAALKAETKVEELDQLQRQVRKLKEEVATTEKLIKEEKLHTDCSVDIKKNEKAEEVGREKFDGLEKSIYKLTDLIEKSKEYVNILTTGKGQCPVCQSELSETKKNSVVENYKKEITEALEQRQKLQASKESVQKYLTETKFYRKTLQTSQARYLESQSYIKGAEVSLEKEKKQLEDLSIKVVKLQELKATINNLDVLKKEMSRLTDKRDSILEERTKAEKDLEECKGIKDAIAKAKRKIRSVEAEMRIAEVAISVFDKNGILVDMIKYISQMIEQWSNHLLSLLADSSINVKLDKDDKGVSVLIDWDNSLKEYIMYSGGEKTLINFAVRLGFSMTLSAITGFIPSVLLLDEVLGKLDEVNRQQMVKIVNYVGDKGFEQVLLITHTTLKDYLTQVIVIDKVNGESKRV